MGVGAALSSLNYSAGECLSAGDKFTTYPPLSCYVH